MDCNESTTEIRQNENDVLGKVTSLCTVKSGTAGASWTNATFGCPRSETTPTPTIQPTPIDDDVLAGQLDEIKDETVKNPEAGAEKLKELTGSVESFTEEQVGNFSKTLLESIDSMPKPISTETSTLFLDSMANMFRKVFRSFILIHFDHFTKVEIHIV